MTDELKYGAAIAWTPGSAPERIVLNGLYVRVEPLNAAIHSAI